MFNYHLDKKNIFLDFIISKAPHLQSLLLQNVQIDELSSFLNLERLSFAYCRISDNICEAIEQQQIFRNLKVLKYQQNNDLIHIYDSYVMRYIICGSLNSLQSLYLNVNLFAYGDDGRMSNLKLPKLRELVITLTPKLRPEHIEWIQIHPFCAPNVKNLCLIFNPCHFFDVDTVVQYFSASVENVMIVSSLYDHEDVLRFVAHIQYLVRVCKELDTCWMKVEDWPLSDMDELQMMLDALQQIKCVVVRLDYKTKEKMKINLENAWIGNEHDVSSGGFNILEISRNKAQDNNEWLQFDKQMIFDHPNFLS